MKFGLPLLFIFLLSSCLSLDGENESPNSADSSPINKKSSNQNLYFGTQQKPLLTLDYITIEFSGERINLENLDRIKITGSNLGNSSEYGGDFIRQKRYIKQVRDPKDKYFKIYLKTLNGNSTTINLNASEGIIRL